MAFHDKYIVSSYTPERAKKVFSLSSCHSRHTLENRRPKAIVTLLNSIQMVPNVLEVFRTSIINCTSLIDPGLYSTENTFLFLSPNKNMTKQLFENIFEDREVRRHANVLGVSSLSVHNIAVWQYNLYAAKIETFSTASNEGYLEFKKNFLMQVQSFHDLA